MTDWNVDRWERLEEISQSVAPDETLSLMVGERIIEARITGTRPAPKAKPDYPTWADGYQVNTPE